MSPISKAPPKRLFIRSWGCQMNVYDSARMADVLAPLGYAPADTPEQADMIVLNTCHIRERASEKLFSELGRLRPLKLAKEQSGGRMILAVAGCVAQAEGAEITARAPYVDLVMGPQSYHRLPEMIARLTRAVGSVIETDFPTEEKFDFLPDSTTPQGVTAFLTIQEGCDKFCSFCVVPYTRGSEFSRSAKAVLAEARHLVSQGAREIALLGQNVNAWHGEGLAGGTWTLSRLLLELAEIRGLARLRYTTSHPRDMDDALIAAHGTIPQLLPFLHLPVQSGSDRMLQAMNRGHKAADYLRIVDKLRAARPDIALSSDFIAGHPGETLADHQATLDLIEQVGFALAYSFTYSSRPGTPASTAALQVADAEKSRRLQDIQALLRQQQDDFNRSCVGRRCEILVTGGGRHPGQFAGRSPWLQPVHGDMSPGVKVDGPSGLVGQLIPAVVTVAMPNSLTVRLEGNEAAGAPVQTPRQEKAAA